MKRALRVRVLGVVATSVLAVLVTLTACSDNGEGERCQVANGDSDCQSGLVCVPTQRAPVAVVVNADASDGSAEVAEAGINQNNRGNGYVNSPYDTSDRCCPADRSTATHPACTVNGTTAGGDSGIPPADTGPVPEASTGTDASNDSGSDAADANTGDAADAADQ